MRTALLLLALTLAGLPTARAEYTPEQLVRIGKAYADRGQDEKALEVLGEALAGKPKNAAEAEYLLGLLYSRQQRLEEATGHLERSLALDGSRYDAWLLLGMTRDLVGDSAGAARAYRGAIERAPGRPEAHRELGMTLLAAGKVDEAVAVLGKAHSLAPRDADVLGDYGYALLVARRCEQAAEVLSRARAAKPRSAPTLTHLGDAQACLGEADEAVASYEAALRLEPDNGRALFHLGLMRARRGELDAARQALEKAKVLDPENPGIARALDRLKNASR
jgi:Flp pilus assembly protein TadD